MRDAITGHSKEVTELMNNVQQYMFSRNTPVVMTKDKGRFFNLMFALYNYETTVSLGKEEVAWSSSQPHVEPPMLFLGTRLVKQPAVTSYRSSR